MPRFTRLTVVLMAASRNGETKRANWCSALKRFAQVVYHWLCLLSCLSGYTYFDAEAVEYEAAAQRRLRAVNVMRPRPFPRQNVEQPDLYTQYEDLLDTVWRCEQRARFEDRLDALARFEQLRSKRSSRRN